MVIIIILIIDILHKGHTTPSTGVERWHYGWARTPVSVSVEPPELSCIQTERSGLKPELCRTNRRLLSWITSFLDLNMLLIIKN